MKKCLRYAGIVGLFVTLAFGIVYESSTHVLRGRLRGEAFFEGRPTSYWRAKLDHWLTQFVQPEDAVRAMILLNGAEAVDGIPLLRPDRHPVWSRVLDLFQSEAEREREWDTPAVLMGHADAEPVLRELARDEKYRLVAEQALR
jgi:hypothetical protein